jgi:dTDP-4-dehydrorhamnose 3,5-epimerase
MLTVTPTNLPDVVVLEPVRHGDARGFFSESWSAAHMKSAGLDFDFVQDNHSFSSLQGTVRGLHFQAPPQAQDKLVRCGRGTLFDVAVDIRRGSPTYGQWTGVELSFENGLQLLVPAGFAHGFMTLTPDCEIIYKCTDTYAPTLEGAVLWNDPQIGIAWPLADAAILSDKDAAAAPLSALETPFTYGGAS